MVPSAAGNQRLFSVASSQGEKQDENQHKIYSTFSTSAGFLFLSSGCGKSPEDAREELGTMNIQYTEEAFLDRVENNDLRAVELFITAGMNPEVRDGSPLQKATEHGHIEIVKLLLDHSADVNAKATVNWTALMAASRGGHAEIVRLLLDHGADVNVKGSRGTALKTASSEGHTEIVRLLLESPVEVNIKNDVGNTALIDGSRGGHLGIVRLLLNHDQDVDVKNNAGNTALMDASRGGHVRVVELLKAAGAKDLFLGWC